MDRITWVESGGGPLIVIPVEIAHLWRGDGGLGLPDGDLSMVWETVRKHTDYGRACGVDDYLGVLAVGPGECLVLGDEPLATTFLPNKDGGLIVRWVHAECEEDVVRAIQVDSRGCLGADTAQFPRRQTVVSCSSTQPAPATNSRADVGTG